jgi:hypothetical protein
VGLHAVLAQSAMESDAAMDTAMGAALAQSAAEALARSMGTNTAYTTSTWQPRLGSEAEASAREQREIQAAIDLSRKEQQEPSQHGRVRQGVPWQGWWSCATCREVTNHTVCQACRPTAAVESAICQSPPYEVDLMSPSQVMMSV